jgi:glycerol-3-phosphate O-acyltransferase/dihydroxyacetone phosphate acyltransferase
MASEDAPGSEAALVASQSAKPPVLTKELYPMSNWKYDTFLWTTSVLVDLFFREVHPRGSWKVPRHGPVLFVAAPHANQVCFLSFSCPFLLSLFPPLLL